MNSFDVILDFAPCRIGARFTGEALTGLSYLPLGTPLTRNLDQRAKHLANELEHYTRNPTHVFDLLFVPCGSPFQLRVWRALLTIPAGQTLSYGVLAPQLKTASRQALLSARAFRQVGTHQGETACTQDKRVSRSSR